MDVQWTIEGFSTLPTRVESEQFEIGGYLWCVVMWCSYNVRGTGGVY